jgi:methionyl-tRNA formyltransferase
MGPGAISADDRSYRRNNQPVVLLIGSHEMAVQCAKTLLENGFDIAGIHSPDAPLREWAAANNQLFLDPFEEFRQWAESIAFDYLFSVVNFRILPASMLRAARCLAINYHDAPLPKYAGTHSCRWALHNREATHGITWHVMTDHVDGGDILRQATFPIAADDTLQRLHQKCYLSAMQTFAVLLADLKTDSFTRVPQDLSQRTYYTRASRALIPQ